MFASRLLRSNKIIYNLSCYDIQEVFQEKSFYPKPLNKIHTSDKLISKTEEDKKREEQNLKYLSQK